ncbi:DUF4276 family protein [Flavobacterium filum]|uniref:DUF4276 family protein n=1 Tax=Flavobacterium TaxID=237 RepID=UPI00041CCBA5|nr:DUF4276 family protein [Flavobacterium filum]
MSNFILAGLYTEGKTDIRFLSSVVERTLFEIAYDCTGDIETELVILDFNKKGMSFNEQVQYASKLGQEKYGILLLFIHTDSDDENDDLVLNTKINPALELLLQKGNDEYCKNLVAIVPIQMTESWMIADRDLLKDEIGIAKTDAELGIHLNPELIKNPKFLIEDIIRLSKEDLTKRKRNKGLDISDLYQIIGQSIDLSKLDNLSSYIKFKNSLIEKLKELNFYHNK